jgi:hypothetical protein
MYKTQNCRSFLQSGHCRYGTRCQFAHGQQEIRSKVLPDRYKTSICKNFSKNTICYYGSECNFVHIANPRSHPFELVAALSCLPAASNSRRLPIFQDISTRAIVSALLK